MAAAYTAAPATAPTPIPTEVPLTGDELLESPPRGAPLLSEVVSEPDGFFAFPWLLLMPFAPGIMGMAGLIIPIKVLVDASGLLYKVATEVCKSSCNWLTASDGTYTRAKVVM